jgi:cellulose synthase/poly-beta-1,6-N-acetylglucosamine synthase-like glycosyltransferase
MADWNLLLLALAFVVAAPMCIWAIECTAALLFSSKRETHAGEAVPRVTILVPAHNEAGGIRRTLESLRPQISDRDSIVVIADNCVDETAAIARQCQATVIERRDAVRRGKSYAVEFGVRSAQAASSDVVIVVDADCVARPGAIPALARMAFRTGHPVQASYYLEFPAAREPERRIAALAFLIKNVIRPRGLAGLGLPCLLNGSGMAFPASLIRAIRAYDKLSEDYWMAADLALAGHTTVFCEESWISSSMPAQEQAMATQRTRWIHGHLECMMVQGPRLLLGAIRQRRLALLALAADLLVPPFSILIVLWLLGLAFTAVAGLLGAGWSAAILLAACGAWAGILFAVLASRFGGGGFWKAMALIPRYILRRAGLLGGFVFGRQKTWIPTARDPRELTSSTGSEETARGGPE